MTLHLFHEVGLIPILYAFGGVLAPLIRLSTRKGNVYSIYNLVIALITMYLSYRVFTYVIEYGVITYPFGGWPPPLGIVYTVDFLNAVYGLIASILFLIVSIYNLWYFNVVADPSWLSTLLLLNMAGVSGCIYTGDIFNFFVMLEVLAISSYSLVAYFKKRKWALEAALSYGFIGALATSFFFFGAVFLYAGYGTLNIADITAKAHGINTSTLSILSGLCTDTQCFGNIVSASATAIALMLWALTFEAGIFPNNYWLPSAYTETPSPASAVFAGIVDKVGTYGVLRIFITMFSSYAPIVMFNILGIPFRDLVLYILSILGFVTAFLGAIIMAVQNDVKRLLSYSTMMHIGIIFMSMACLTSATDLDVRVIALTGILFHSLVHALGESMLFLGLGALATIANSRRIDSMRGYGRVYPILSISIVIGIFSLIGIAPLGGFFSKYILFLAMMSAGMWIYAISLVVISGISIIGYIKVLYTLYMLKPVKEVKKFNLTIVDIICTLVAIALIVVGIAYAQGYLFNMFKMGCEEVVSIKGIQKYINTVDQVSKLIIGIKP